MLFPSPTLPWKWQCSMKVGWMEACLASGFHLILPYNVILSWILFPQTPNADFPSLTTVASAALWHQP